MNRVIAAAAAALVLGFAGLAHGADQVPAGKENLVIDGVSKAKEAAGKKVIKGPVPFGHQAHVALGLACKDCHHKQAEGETPKLCSECHKEKADGNAPKLSDVFHGADSLPALQSCIGCHSRKIPDGKVTNAPKSREPCTACHSVKK
jgi:hypothetical protein